MTYKMPLRLLIINCFLVLFLQGCGSGSSSDNSIPPVSNDPTYTVGTYQPAANFKNQCQVVRTVTDIDGNPYPDIQGSTLHENHWLRSWSNDTYLWYSELPDLNPGSYNDPIEYFQLLKTSEVTASGSPKDNFHFEIDTTEYEQLTVAGISVSYGIEWELTSPTVPRELYIRFIEPLSPAAAANLTRGVKVIAIDGIDVETDNTETGINTLNAGLYPSMVGESHTFTILDVGATVTRDVTLIAEEVTANPVPIVDTFSTNNGNVGYIFFNDHNFVSEDKLFDAFEQLSNSNINDLILDLRYNGGGYLYIASQLSYMVAGNAATNGKTFEQLRFNDKHPTVNPITNSNLDPTPFYNQSSQYSDARGSGVALPTLTLNRVFILTTDGTCSASEAIINGLSGIDIEVILIGDTTCGKPYGFYATDNCGTTYFTIQFDGVNDKNEGGYSDGFTPMNDPIGAGQLKAGCYVVDDLTESLGNSSEGLIAAALQYRETGTCPAITKSSVAKSSMIEEQNGLKLKQDNPIPQKIYLDPYKDKSEH